MLPNKNLDNYSTAPGPGSTIDETFLEAERQLNICNACRYCEGYCAVFPALESKTLLNRDDIVHLANLCHDCRDCYYACMYAPPHIFAVNPPKILSEIRRYTYDGNIGSSKGIDRKDGIKPWVIAATSFISLLLLILISGKVTRLSSMWANHPSAVSPYQIIPYAGIVITMGILFLYGVYKMAINALRYIRQGKVQFNLDALWMSLNDVAHLTYLKGGGANCSYPTEKPSPIRRLLHSATSYGFAACLMSTISAAILQDILNMQPPYSLISVPVILGTIGGIGLLVGSSGLVVLKFRSSPEPTDLPMAKRDYLFLAGLISLSITGLLTLILRDYPIYGMMLIIHLTFVAASFVLAPYTKFVHFIYRFIALVRENVEISNATHTS